MLVKRKRGKGVVLLAALVVGVALLAIPALAACPPGSVLINTAQPAPLPLLETTTYCVDQDITLGAGGQPDSLVLRNNTRLVGAAGVKVTGSGIAPICEIDGLSAQISNISLSAAGGEPNGVQVDPAGSDSVIKAVTIDDAGGAFWTSHIEILGGLDVVVQGCVIRTMQPAGWGGGIWIGGGNNHHIIDNTIQVNANPGFEPIAAWAGNGHQILRNLITNSTATTVNQIAIGSTSTQVDRNVITLNALRGVGNWAIGISVWNAMIDVTNNTINNTGGFVQTGNLVGIAVWGTNALIKGNRVTGCGTKDDSVWPAPGDAILVGGANVIVEDNPILQVSVAENVLWDIACGIRVLPNAVGVRVLNNPNINSATSGIYVGAPNTEVRGNTITDSCTGAAVPVINSPVGGIVVDAPGSESAPIDGNTIMNVSQRNPAVLGSGSGIVMIGGSSNQYITNNEVWNAANNGIEVADAGSVSNHIIGNEVYQSTANGFYIEVGASNTLVQGNTFQDNLNSGIFVTGNALSTRVIGNTLVNNGSKGSPPVAPDVSEALVVSGGADNTKVLDNTISTNVALSENRGIRIEGVRNVIVDGNIIKNTATGDSMTHGIVIEPGTSNDTISNNDIEGMSEAGIVINGGSGTLGKVHVEGNTLNNDTVGILFAGGASVVDKCNEINACTGFKVEPGVLVTNHVFNGNCVTTTGKYAVQDSMTGTFDATGNYWGDVPPNLSKFAGRGTIDYSGYLSICPCGGPGPSVCCTYQPGWNLISMKVDPSSTSIPPDLQPYKDDDTLWRYEPGPGYYHPTQISGSEGYWIHVAGAAVQICVQGTIPSTDQSIELDTAGWHQIGTYIAGAYWTNTKVEYNGVIKSLADAVSTGWIAPIAFGYDPQTGEYYSASALHACQGYWVRTYIASIKLEIPRNQPPPTPSSVQIKGLSSDLLPPPPPSLPDFGGTMGELVFTNEPNPITDVHTTTFMVKGTMASRVETIKVQIFDLSGRLVYESGEVPGTSLDWHTDSGYGEYLANGVYLYKMYAKVGNQWVVGEVKKLAIIR